MSLLKLRLLKLSFFFILMLWILLRQLMSLAALACCYLLLSVVISFWMMFIALRMHSSLSKSVCSSYVIIPIVSSPWVSIPLNTQLPPILKTYSAFDQFPSRSLISCRDTSLDTLFKPIFLLSFISCIRCKKFCLAS